MGRRWHLLAPEWGSTTAPPRRTPAVPRRQPRPRCWPSSARHRPRLRDPAGPGSCRRRAARAAAARAPTSPVPSAPAPAVLAGASLSGHGGARNANAALTTMTLAGLLLVFLSRIRSIPDLDVGQGLSLSRTRLADLPRVRSNDGCGRCTAAEEPRTGGTMRKFIFALVLTAACFTAAATAGADTGPIQVSGESAGTSQGAVAGSGAFPALSLRGASVLPSTPP